MSFRDYLSTRAALSTLAGGFARRVLGDAAAPDFDSWQAVSAYLEAHRAPIVEIYAARGTWLAYRRALKRRGG